MDRSAGTWRIALPGLTVVLLLGGCATPGIPEDALRLTESTLELRSMQTRRLAAPSEATILTAAIAVLQDMEFNIERIEKPLGVISASKVSDADDSGEKTTLFFLDVLCAAGGSGNCDNQSRAKDKQHVYLTMVVLPSLEKGGEYSVRFTMQWIIYDKAGRVLRQERIADASIYQEAFDNLRRAIFLETGDT